MYAFMSLQIAMIPERSITNITGIGPLSTVYTFMRLQSTLHAE